MKLKKIFTIILLIFMLNSVFSALDDTNKAYWTLDNVLTDLTGNGYTLSSINGATYTASGKINGAYNFDGTDDYLRASSVFPSTNSDFTLSAWVKSDETTRGDYFGQSGFGKLQVGSTIGKYGATINFNTDSISLTSTTNIDTSNYVFTVLTYNATSKTGKLYINGFFEDSDTSTGTKNTNSNILFIGAEVETIGGTVYNAFEGNIDEVSVWNTVLTQNDIDFLYATGTPTTDQRYPYSAYTELIISDNVKNYYNTENITIQINTTEITNISYILNSGTETSICTDCDTTYLNLYELSEGQQNFTIVTPTLNKEKTFIIDTIKPVINIFNSSESNSFYVDWTTRFNYSDTNLDSCYILYNETELNCSSYTFNSVGNKSINIFVNDSAGNSINETYNQLINPYNYFYFYDVSNSSFISDFTFGGYSSIGDYVTIPFYDIGEGEHSLNFSKIGFVTKPVSFNFTTTEILNLTTNILRSTIVLKIYDRQTDNLLTGLTQVQILATTGYESNTTTGLLNITVSEFINEMYTIILTHEGYSPELFYFNYDNQEILNINVYMINSSVDYLGFVTLKTITDTGELIAGAVCSVLEWKPDLSSYQAVSYGETNPNGEVSLQIELGSKIYKFSCYKGDQSATTVSQVIKTTGQVIPIILQKVTVTPLDFFENFNYELTNSSYNSTHQRIKYTFSDVNNLVSTGCLNIYKKSGTKLTLIQSSCLDSTTGEIQLIQDINQTYTIITIATIEQGNIKIQVDSITFLPDQSLLSFLEKYHFDVILPILFIFIGISFGLLLKPQNIYMSMFGVIIMVWIAFGIVTTVVSGSIAIFVTTICLLMWWGTS